MVRRIIGVMLFLWVIIAAQQVQATHIQYLDIADLSGVDTCLTADTSLEWEFDLLTDLMYLWEIDTPTTTYGPTPADLTTADSIGSYDITSELHYVYLHIDPNKVQGSYTSGSVELRVNGVLVSDWYNPISIYDWGVPGDPISDPYGIAASDYKITITLTGMSDLSRSICVTNINLEGCFDEETPGTEPVPEPGTMVLFGCGIIGIAVVRSRSGKQ